MNKGAAWASGLVAVTVAASAGYWLGNRSGASREGQPADRVVAPAKPLYYRNPMGLPDTSPVPKKDPMGMDYIPVYAGDQEDKPGSPKQVSISVEKIQKLGVRTEMVQLRALDKVIRAAGRIESDERRIYTVSPKFEGYVERLHVNITGQPVSRGQPLFEVYSPELVSAQREYAIAIQGIDSLKEADGQAQNGMRQLADSSLMRLRNWDISEEQLKTLVRSGTRKTLTFRSPVSGIVTEKKALPGMRFMPGEALYQITDLGMVWVLADVFEQDIGMVRPGTKAKVWINAYPEQVFEGTITYVYPTLKVDTRTIPVRIELPNPGQLLKPGMFAQVELPVADKGQVLAVPTSAVIDSGTRRIVLVQAKEGRFEPREVTLGQRSDNYVEVVNGVRDGEAVVVAANFLIDAESNLQAAINGFGHASHGSKAAAPNHENTGHPSTRPAMVGHQAEGTVDSIDIQAGTVTVNHGPVSSLKWPAMTMDFALANPSLISGIKTGSTISFEFVERKPGEWVITAIKPGASGKASAPGNSHAGH